MILAAGPRAPQGEGAEICQAYKQYVDEKLEALGLELPDERTNRYFV